MTSGARGGDSQILRYQHAPRDPVAAPLTEIDPPDDEMSQTRALRVEERERQRAPLPFRPPPESGFPGRRESSHPGAPSPLPPAPAPTFGPPPAPWPPPLPPVALPAAPSFAQPQRQATIGEHLSRHRWPATDAAPLSSSAPVTPSALASVDPRTHLLEMLWSAADSEERARQAPLVAEELGPVAAPGDAKQSRRAVQRALARLTPVDDIQGALWDSVDEDRVLTPPIVAVTGELELFLDDAEYAKTLALVARPFAAGDGDIEDRIDRLTGIADRLPEASALLMREISALERAWADRDGAMPFEEIEADAKRMLQTKRRFRTIEIFEAVHMVAVLHLEAGAEPLPVYIPESARGHVPLDNRFEARVLVEIHPRQVADATSPFAALGLALARVVRG